MEYYWELSSKNAQKIESSNVGYPPEIITIRFASWISGKIVSLQQDKDIQKLL